MSEDAVTDLLEFSFHFRDVLFCVRRLQLFVLLSFVVCNFQPSLLAISAADWASF